VPYTQCSACGAKALVGATRCPRCQAPFVSYDLSGERVPTVNCPTCGVQRPVAIGVCPNCMTSTAPAGARLTRGLMIIGVAISGMMGVGYLLSRHVDEAKRAVPSAVASTDSGRERGATQKTKLEGSTTDSMSYQTREAPPQTRAPAEVRMTSGTRSAPASGVAPQRATPAPIAKPALDPAMVPPKPAQPPTVAVSDTGAWEYATAITWVRVRAAPTRESAVLRMVESAQRVRLGPPLNGWRPVHVGVDRGWVDPRLFTLAPARP
jgi:hypothetical protein